VADRSQVPNSDIPAFSHVWLVVLENTGYDRIVGASEAPYLNGLIDRYGLAEAYQAVARPSQPNYLALFSGSTHGVEDNDVHDIDAPTIVDQLEGAGRTWRAYAENLPPDCFLGPTASGGPDGPGTYARKHMPALSFTTITGDPDRCALVSDLSGFAPANSDFAFIVPNLCHAMHDCSVAEGDAWLADFLPRIIDSPAFAADGLLVVTFDEGDADANGPGRVATIVVAPGVAGIRSNVAHDHFGLLRTVEDAWGLGCLEESCGAQALTEFFAAP
jgi:hypothetical protein